MKENIEANDIVLENVASDEERLEYVRRRLLDVKRYLEFIAN